MKNIKRIGVFGISGVGKSTFVKALIASRPDIKHLQASDLIKQGKESSAVTSENLRQLSNERFLSNQDILLMEYKRELARTLNGVVIFDGHLVIDTGEEIVETPISVIDQLNLSLLVHLCEAPEIIVERRKSDTGRERPVRTSDEIKIQQRHSLNIGKQYADTLAIPFTEIQSGDISRFCEAVIKIEN